MIEKAMYTLSGDPLTYGHIDIVKRAKEAFGSLRVALAVNPRKSYTFTLEEREKLARKVLQGLDVNVVSYPGHTIDYAKMNGIHIVVRSVRGMEDFNFEKVLNDVGRSQDEGIDTVLFFSQQHMSHISSSAVKELQRIHGTIHQYVPFIIKQALEKKISKQLLIGLTGEIGAGKSFVAKTMRDTYSRVYEIDMDHLGHEILETNTNPRPLFLETREKLFKIFSDNIRGKNPSTVDVKALGSLIFSDKHARNIFNSIMIDPMLALYREKLDGLEGVVLVSSALLAEGKLGYLTNNNVILVGACGNKRRKRLQMRGYSEEEIKNRMDSQLDFDRKRELLEDQISESGYGNLLRIDNTEDSTAALVKLKCMLNPDDLREFFEKDCI